MELSFGPEYDIFRNEVKTFLHDQKAASAKGPGSGNEGKAWQKTLIKHGYTARTIPGAYGGFGAEPDILKSRIIAEEFSHAGMNQGLGGQGISMLVPTLLELGTE
ncbi:MAG: alkylation response protein AidB-like acyl-CoA dehydrogenase, partial [Patiriisocius sp.]